MKSRRVIKIDLADVYGHSMTDGGFLDKYMMMKYVFIQPNVDITWLKSIDIYYSEEDRTEAVVEFDSIHSEN